MQLTAALAQAVRSLATNPLRTLLTTLGIVIGVGSVIALLSLAAGFNQLIVSEIRGAGANLMVVFPGGGGGGAGSVFRPGTSGFLSLEDAQALRETEIPNLDAITVRSGSGAVVRIQDCADFVGVDGTDFEHFAVSGMELDFGRGFTRAEYESGAAVAVLGSNVAERMLGIRGDCDAIVSGLDSDSPAAEVISASQKLLGQAIRIGNGSYTVVGIAKGVGQGFLIDDNNIVIPLTTKHYRLAAEYTPTGEISVNQIALALGDESEETLAQVRAEVASILRARHRVEEDDFQFLSQSQILDVFAQITVVASVFLGSIGGISLLVGGIGIMNIMLVTVTERTREIGIRKALGARYRDLMFQFLIESVVLSILGGALGVGFGWLIAFGVGQIPIADGDPLPTLVETSSVMLALGVASGIGLVFGLYPANRAARLNPIDALRYE